MIQPVDRKRVYSQIMRPNETCVKEYKTCYYTVITNMNPAAVLHWYTAL